MPLKVNEIFYSIQGESTFAGLPCAFIRLTGCNLRCSYCDTRYAYEEGTWCSVEQLLDRVAAYGCSLVEVTGGEPLLQEETPRLVERLLRQGYQVLLETNGSLDITPVDPRCVRIVDFKCPSSGEADKNRWENWKSLSTRDQVKFVLGRREDYLFARDVLKRRIGGEPPPFPVLFSPVHGLLEPRTLARWILEDRLPVRLHLQLHKIIWGARARGV